MIKLFTINRNPSQVSVITPLDGVQMLTISNAIEPWDTLPPNRFVGAIECACYENLQAMLKAHDSADVDEMLARRPGDRCIAVENVIIDGRVRPSSETVKSTSLIRRSGDFSRQMFLEHYPQRHAPLVRKTPELRRYVQNYAIESSIKGGFDGVAELWWPDRDTAIRSWSSEEIQIEQFADCKNFLSFEGCEALFGDERFVVGSP
jgi:uncharacterized protein (TIGR02118 family)